MKVKSRRFMAVDILYILLMVLPMVCGIILQILTKPPTEGIEIAGARIFFTIPMPLQDLPITESQVNSFLVVLTILGFALFITHGISVEGGSRRQIIAEWIVEVTDNMVNTNMGEYFAAFAPFVAGIMALSALSSLMSLLGLYPPTSDMNIVGGWALLVFVLITYYKGKCGPIVYMKSFTEPAALLTPLNVISEIATPVSMAFRHYGNILSGTVISVLLAAGLQGVSNMIFGWLPGFLGEFGWLRIGIPAVLSLYFDIFSGCLQAFIFAMLTMLYISGAFPQDEFERRQRLKLEKQKTIK